MDDGFFFKFTNPPKMGPDGLPKTGDYKVPKFGGTGEPICVDLGSACGGFVARVHSKFSKVYAFDACYPNFLTTKKLVDELGVQNCAVFNLAAGRKSGDFVDISWNSQKRPYGNQVGLFSENDVGHRVLSISYDDIFDLIGKDSISYLKLDIEGCEYDFLYGRDLSRVDVIALELHQGILGFKAQKLVKYIQRQGFKLVFDGGSTNVDLTFENKRPKLAISWDTPMPEIVNFSGQKSVLQRIRRQCKQKINSFAKT